MQPNQDPQQWQQPSEKPSQAPYEATPGENNSQPVVTITPDHQTAVPTTTPQGAPTTEAVSDEPVRWQATEYIHRHKGAGWFIVFSIVVVIAMAVAILLMKSVTFAILVPVMAAALVVYAYRPPRVLDYTLSRKGLHVNDRLYSFQEFKGFGVIHDDDEYSVMLIPTKRFKPGVYVYFPEEAGEAIVDMLAARLPMQELHMDVVDRLIRKLRI